MQHSVSQHAHPACSRNFIKFHMYCLALAIEQEISNTSKDFTSEAVNETWPQQLVHKEVPYESGAIGKICPLEHLQHRGQAWR